MTYFHIRMYTIIGAKSFHCPVRDGKEWGQLAMVVRHRLHLHKHFNFAESRVETVWPSLRHSCRSEGCL